MVNFSMSRLELGRAVAVLVVVALGACAAETSGNGSRTRSTGSGVTPIADAEDPAGSAGAAGAGSLDFGNGIADSVATSTDPTAATAGAPQAAGEFCVSGTYTGEYLVDFMLGGDGGLPFPAAGPFEIALEAGDSGGASQTLDGVVVEFFQIAEGATLDASYAGLIELASTLEGGVDCETGEFEASSTVCMYGTLGLNSPGCSVEMLGAFDPHTRRIEGSVTIPNDWGLSEGSFSTALLP